MTLPMPLKSWILLLCSLLLLVCFVFADEQDEPVLDDNLIAAINNNPSSSWKAARNKVFEGVTKRQVKRFLGDLHHPMSDVVFSNSERKQPTFGAGTPPTSFDARTKWPSCIHPIRDQEDCGSCWAFSSSEVFSDRYCIASNGTVNVVLSPQALVSCDTAKSLGCDGGNTIGAWNYFANPGIPTDECYPYTSGGGDSGVCKTVCADSTPFVNFKAKPNSVVIFRNDVEGAQNAIMTYGPVTASYDVYNDFYSYSSGVYRHITGSLHGSHGVKVIGWGVDSVSGYDYWIVANSWGSSWGNLGGFFWIRRGNNECGFEDRMAAGFPETATKLSLSSLPGTVLTADDVFTLQVHVENMADFLVTDSNAVVNLGVKNNGSLLLNGGSKQAVSGIAQYSGLSIRVAGQNYIIEATSNGLTSVQTLSFDVIHGNPTTMQILQQPGGAIAGSMFQIQPRVILKDSWGNQVQLANGNVTVSISNGYGPEGAELQGVVSVEMSEGEAQFLNLRIDKAGLYRLHFDFNGSVFVDSAVFQVMPRAPNEINIITQPGNSTAGGVIDPQPSIQVKDEFNNSVANGTEIRVSIASGGDQSMLQGTTTITTTNGIASFSNLRIDVAGTFTLKFSCSNLMITSDEIHVNPSSPSQLHIITQPGNSTAGEQLNPQPSIQVKDEFHNSVANGTEIRVSIASGGDQSMLQGTTTITTMNGIAQFLDLHIDQSGVFGLNFTCLEISVLSDEIAISAPLESSSTTVDPSLIPVDSSSTTTPSVLTVVFASLLWAMISQLFSCSHA